MNDRPRNQYVLLDRVAGWRAASLEHLELVEPDGDLRLDAIPGIVQPFGTKALASIKCPSALALDFCAETLYVLDRASAKIFALPLAPLLARDAEPDHCTVATPLPGIGGSGGDVRHLRNPHGLALFPDGSLAVADTGNGRVQIFSAAPHALLEIIDGLDRPWGVAVDRRGKLVIADRATPVANASELALAPTGLLAVVAGGVVVLFEGGQQRGQLRGVTNATSAAFDDGANLFVGTDDGLVWKFAPLSNAEYRLVGVGVTGRDGAVLHLRFHAKFGLLAILRNPNGAQIWRIDPAGGYVNEGLYVTDVLDSRIESCAWHRVELRGEIPDGASIEVTTETADDETALTGTFARQPVHLLGAGASDCLVLSARGRYLRLRLHFRSSSVASPRIHSIKVHFPRESYLQYLPAVYQDDPDSRDFLARYLSIFQTSLDGFDRRIDDLWQLFDPHSTPAAYLPWLAGWLAVPLAAEWSEAHTRDVLARAWSEEQRRGTVAGIEQAIIDYAGVRGATIVEHFRLRNFIRLGETPVGHAPRLWSRGYYARLQIESWSRVGYFRLTGVPEPAAEAFDWGANDFSVFFQTSAYSADDDRQRVARVVEREKPAHTRAVLCPVLPRFRVGVQSTIGVDSVVGDISHLVLGKLATLGHDSILASLSSSGRGPRAAAPAGNPRAGVNTQLL